MSVNIFSKIIININQPKSQRHCRTAGRLLARETTESPSGLYRPSRLTQQETQQKAGLAGVYAITDLH